MNLLKKPSRYSLLSAVILLFLAAPKVFSQTPDFTQKIRIPLWADLDAYPGAEEPLTDGKFDFPVKRLKILSPYLINGMIYGWYFEFTPSDKLRAVKEYFNTIEIDSIEKSSNKIHYSEPWIENNRLYCWVEYERTDDMKWLLKNWFANTSELAHGRGKGPVSKGFDGIKEACDDALKDAIRSHYSPIIKNKPKEIDGRVLIRKEPRIGISNGYYIVELDFFLISDRIIKYTQF